MQGRLTRAAVGIAVLFALLAAGLGPPPAAHGEVVQESGVRIAYDAKLSPRELPRRETAPATVTFGARITPLDGRLPPRLRTVRLAINRHGYFDPSGLPSCRVGQIQPATTDDALRECGRSQVGEGFFAAKVSIADQPPFPARGRVLSFYGRYRGRPAILAHVYGRQPIPTSYTIPFVLRRARGAFGTVLSASFEESLGRGNYITMLRMTLGGRFGHLWARCPAPPRTASTVFPLASLSIGFPRRTLRTTLLRSCRVS